MQSVAGAFVSVELWLYLVSGFVALLSIVAVGVLIVMRHVGVQFRYWLPVFVWALHALAFLNTNMVARTFNSYTLPTVLFTSWGLALLMHALLTITIITIWVIVEVRKWSR